MYTYNETVAQQFQIYKLGDCTVNYNANGGKVSPTSKSVSLNSKYGDLPTPTQTGYTFNGWYTEQSGGSKVTSGSKVLTPYNHMIYAHWSINKLAIHYNANGGILASDSEYYLADNSDIYIKSTNDFAGNNWNYDYAGKNGLVNPGTFKISRTGYNFTGWSLSKTADTIYDPHDNTIRSQDLYPDLKTKSGTVKLFARWEARKYKVNFDANGGEVSPANITVSYDSKYTGMPEPTRKGYNFNGWYTDPEGGTAISANTKVQITSDQTLYAHWDKEKMLISFNANGGQTEAEDKLVIYDNRYGILPEAERAGYVFDGWYLDKDFTEQISEDTIVKITENQEVFAKWSLDMYTVHFEAEGGTSEADEKQVFSGKNYGVLPEAEKEGSEFAGWITSDGTELTPENTVDLQEDITVYAQWNEIPPEDPPTDIISVLGDLDMDGTFTELDAMLLQEYLLGKESLDDKQLLIADLNDDGKVSCFDLIMIRDLLIELEDT
jgi:uncharacterized repeat protein (TIGR02543 family)